MSDSLERLLGKIEAELAGIRIELRGLYEQRADHELRLRALERWRYAVPASFIIAAGSVAVALLGKLP